MFTPPLTCEAPTCTSWPATAAVARGTARPAAGRERPLRPLRSRRRDAPRRRTQRRPQPGMGWHLRWISGVPRRKGQHARHCFAELSANKLPSSPIPARLVSKSRRAGKVNAVSSAYRLCAVSVLYAELRRGSVHRCSNLEKLVEEYSHWVAVALVLGSGALFGLAVPCFLTSGGFCPRNHQTYPPTLHFAAARVRLERGRSRHVAVELPPYPLAVLLKAVVGSSYLLHSGQRRGCFRLSP